MFTSLICSFVHSFFFFFIHYDSLDLFIGSLFIITTIAPVFANEHGMGHWAGYIYVNDYEYIKSYDFDLIMNASFIG